MPARASPVIPGGDVYVDGYFRKDGKWVNGYERPEHNHHHK